MGLYERCFKDNAIIALRICVAMLLLASVGCHGDLHPFDHDVGIALREAGAVLVLDRDGHIIHVHLNYTSADDSVLELVSKLPTVRGLYLDRTYITDQGLSHLASLHQLQELSLVQTGVTSSGLRDLCKLKNLRALKLDGTLVSDSGLAELQKLGYLRSLWLNGTLVSDQGVVSLGKLKVAELALSGTRISPHGKLALRKKMAHAVIME